MNAIVYDCEIIKAIPNNKEPRISGIEYCGGWQSFDQMGISVIGVYDYAADRYRVFCADNFEEFRKLTEQADVLIGFNNLGFDNKLIRAALSWNLDDKSYDLLSEIWVASGLSPTFSYPSHIGYGLEVVSLANGGTPKTGNGALAPVLWQQGKIGQVIDYAIEDVRLTRRLIDKVVRGEPLTCPKTRQPLTVRKPF